MNSLPLHRARDRRRARAPARDRRRRRRGDAGDAPLRPALGLDHLASLEGGGPRLPLLPRAGPGAAGADRGDARRRARRPARAARPSARSATPRSSGLPDAPRPPARARPGAGRALRGRRRRRLGEPGRRRQLGDRRGPGRARWSPRARRPLVAMVEDGKVTNQAAKKVLAKLAEGGGDPAEIVERRAWGRWRTPASWRRSSTARSKPTPTRRQR